MNAALLQRLRQSLVQREGATLRRRLVARAADDPRVNLADNDYLGLARDPAVVAAATAALRRGVPRLPPRPWSLVTRSYINDSNVPSPPGRVMRTVSS